MHNQKATSAKQNAANAQAMLNSETKQNALSYAIGLANAKAETLANAAKAANYANIATAEYQETADALSALIAMREAASREALQSTRATQAPPSIATMLKDAVDAILENEEVFENMSFADALDALEAELSGWDCLGTRII